MICRLTLAPDFLVVGAETSGSYGMFVFAVRDSMKKRNVDPCPCFEATSMRPPMSSAISASSVESQMR